MNIFSLVLPLEDYLLQIIASFVAVLLFLVARYVTRKLIRKYVQFLHKPELRGMQMKQIIHILLFLLFLFTLAAIWGLDPHNLVIGISSIFAVIGVALFAQWSILSNITAGIIMFFSAPYSIGDHIHIIDKDLPIEATIEKIETFYTHIRTFDNELIVLPNNLFLQKIISVKNE